MTYGKNYGILALGLNNCFVKPNRGRPRGTGNGGDSVSISNRQLKKIERQVRRKMLNSKKNLYGNTDLTPYNYERKQNGKNMVLK